MELLQLTYLCEAVREGSFSAVAKLHMVPPSSVSHTIARLERELGTELFSRSGNKIALNDAGYTFFEYASEALERLESGVCAISQMKEQTVSVILSQGGYSLVPMLTKFRGSHPEIKLFFPFKSLEHKGSFYIRISAVPFEGEEEHCRIPLFHDRILVAVPESYHMAQKDSLCFDDINGMPLIWFSNSPESAAITEYFKKHGAKPNILLECTKEAFAADLVKNGFGIAFYPESAHPIGRSEGVKTMRLSDLDLIRTIYASYPNHIAPNDAAKTFLSFAREYYRGADRC